MTWTSLLCKDSASNSDNGIGFFLGHISRAIKLNKKISEKFYAYLHPRGHFWFNREIPDIVAVPVVSGKQKEINFKIIIHNYMQSRSFNCEMDEDYTLTQCFMDYIRQVKEYEQGEFSCFFFTFYGSLRKWR